MDIFFEIAHRGYSDKSKGILVFAFTNKNIYTLRYMDKFKLNGIVSNLKIR